MTTAIHRSHHVLSEGLEIFHTVHRAAIAVEAGFGILAHFAAMLLSVLMVLASIFTTEA